MSRKLSLALLLMSAAALLLAAVPAPASAQTGARTIEIWAQDDGASDWWFTLANGTAKNPTIEVNAGETVTFHVINKGSVTHNLHVLAPVDKKTELLQAGKEANLTVTIPKDRATIKYQCDPHAGVMEGQLTVKGATAGTTPQQKSPGFELLAAIGAVGVLAALLARRER